MSLINDALKRASAAKPPPGPAPTDAPLQPVLDNPSRPGPLPIILCLVGVGSLLIAGAFWLKSRGTPSGADLARAEAAASAPAEPSRAAPAPPPAEAKAAPPKDPAPAAASTVPAAAPAPVQTKEPVRESPPVATPPVVSAPVVTAPALSVPVAATPAPPPVAPPPSFRLQAIYYRMKGPTVVINGKTLGVGEMVDGATLTAIDRTSAEIEYQGTKQRLTIR